LVTHHEQLLLRFNEDLKALKQLKVEQKSCPQKILYAHADIVGGKEHIFTFILANVLHI
jgi:hypothetical protein